MKCVKIKVTGKVQGVFFRASTKKEADKLNLKGFVRNEADGGVYIEAQGDPNSLDRFIEWAGKGPIAAKVSSVNIEECSAIKKFHNFEVIR